MAILGVKRVKFGVHEPEKWIAFFKDFGLPSAAAGDALHVFALPEGSFIEIHADDAPFLPDRFLATDGPREVIWGVSDKQHLDAIRKNLETDREVTVDADGGLHTTDPNGLRIGFELYDRKVPESIEGTENTIGNAQRVNRRRKWFDRAAPKVIQHVVFGVPDVDAGVEFYVERLGFRISDISRGLGVFMRCDGRTDHHNLFLLRSEKVHFHHVSFGVDNVDELMVGANHMQRQGWRGGHGLGRHRISSMLFYYIKSPSAGEIEYSADGDAVNDDWQPSLWGPKFGNMHWVGEVSERTQEPAEYDVAPLEQPIGRFSTLR